MWTWKQGGRTINQARGEAKRAIFKAKNDERKKFCEDLERENDKGNLFRVAKQLVMMCYQTRSLPGIERILQMQDQCVGLVKGFRHWRWMRLLVR